MVFSFGHEQKYRPWGHVPRGFFCDIGSGLLGTRTLLALTRFCGVASSLFKGVITESIKILIILIVKDQPHA